MKLELTFEEILLTREALAHYKDDYSSYISVVQREKLKTLLEKFTE